MYLAFELCAGGDLRQLLKRKRFLTEDEARPIVRSLAEVVVYLHRRGECGPCPECTHTVGVHSYSR